MSANSVLIVDNCLHAMGTGSISSGEHLAMRLAREGWKVILTSAQQSRILRLYDMTSTAYLDRSEFDVAVVSVFSSRAFFWAEATCWALRRANKPYVLALHGGNLPDFSRRHPTRARRLLQSAQAVVCPSLYLESQMRHYCDRIQVLPNAVDLGTYRYDPRSVASPKLVWLRAFHSIYEPALAVAAFRQILEDYPEALLTMIGRDKGDGSFQKTRLNALDLGVAGSIQFTGAIDNCEIPCALQQGDILLNTSGIDNTPRSVLEAMASGLCVVSTNVGGIPFLLEHEKDALLVPPSSPTAMAEAVRRLIREPGLAARLSANGRAKVLHFDWSLILPRWMSLLGDVIRN